MNSQKIWEILSESSNGEDAVSSENIIHILLTNRGLRTQKEIDKFLHPKLEDVTISSIGIDKKEIRKTIKRLQQAIEKKEKIIVYGDYDVDGITGTAILWETLHSFGAEVIPYIPHRVDEGYGLSVKGIGNILSEHPDVGLIITVDNGIVANDAVNFANEKKIDVVITDHHTIGEKLPKAFAIVHTTQLCGAGVGWMLAQEILNNASTPQGDYLPRRVASSAKNDSSLSNLPAGRASKGLGEISSRLGSNNKYEDHLSLVALATVADLVPLTGTNRILLKFGLEMLKQTKRPGLLALFREAKIEPEKIDVYTIGHTIGPRLNAMGRLESAMDSLRLLCTNNRNRATELAQKLELTNKERQILTSSTVEHAKQQVFALSKKTKILFIHHESYEEGVIGLVAGKLVESFYLPAIVLSKGEKYSKASARSIAGFNIIEAIRQASDLLVNAGGHPMAAGFTVETEKLEFLKEVLEQIADGAIDETMLKRVLRIDMGMPLEKVSQKLYDEIQKLAPFGMSVPEPVFMSEVVIKELRPIGMDGKHLKMSVSPASGAPITMDAIAFGMGDLIAEIKKGIKTQIAYVIDENTWNGKTTLQLKIKDIKY